MGKGEGIGPGGESEEVEARRRGARWWRELLFGFPVLGQQSPINEVLGANTQTFMLVVGCWQRPSSPC